MNTEIVGMAFSTYHRKKVYSLQEAISFLWKNGVINVGEIA
jgi:hypothetical protein